MSEEEALNVSIITKYDPKCVSVCDKSSSSHLYRFNSKFNSWQKMDVRGIFFLYKRQVAPYFAILILNKRDSTLNRIEYINKDFFVETHATSFLLFKCKCHGIFSIWFQSSEDFTRIHKKILDIQNQYNDSKTMNLDTLESKMNEMKQVSSQTKDLKCEKKQTDIFDKLQIAEENFQKMFQKDQAKYQESRKKNRISEKGTEDESISCPKNILDKLSNNLVSSSGGEEQKSSKTKMNDSHTPSKLEKWINNSTDDLKELNKLIDDKMNFVNSLEKLSQNIETSSPDAFEVDSQLKIDNLRLTDRGEYKPITTPKGNKTNISTNANNTKTTKDNEFNPSEYLSRDQLKMSLVHMIHNDDGFVDNLHQAYLSSIRNRLSRPSESTPRKNWIHGMNQNCPQ